MPCPKSRDTTTTTSTSTTTTQIFSVFGNNYLTSLEQQNMMMDPTTNQAAAMDTTRSNAYTAPLQKQQTYQPQQTHDEEYVRPISTDFDSFDGPPVPTTDPKQLMAKIKEKGTAGIISFAMVQTGFWSLSFAVALAAYVEVTGHLPNFSDPEEMSQLGTGTCRAMAKLPRTGLHLTWCFCVGLCCRFFFFSRDTQRPLPMSM